MTKLKTLHLGDVHMGLETNPAPYIADNLRATIHPVIMRENIAAIFIQGDLYDKLIFLNDKYLNEIDIYFSEFISLCTKHKTKIIVLEGTPRHDRKQSKRLVTIATMLGCPDTVTYIDELTIRYEPILKKHILYVPDVIRDSADTVFNDVLEMMHALKIDAVDIAIMHGAFEHQLPIKDKHTHVRDRYESIVKSFICINHVHKFSHVGKVIAPGSFDCTDHTCSNVCGAVKVTHTHNGEYELARVLNKTPMTFESITLRDDNRDWVEKEVIGLIDKITHDFRINISIKMVLNNENKSFYEYLKNNYDRVRWTLSPITIEGQVSNKAIDSIVVPVIEITEDNILSMMSDKLTRMEVQDISSMLKLLEDFIHE